VEFEWMFRMIRSFQDGRKITENQGEGAAKGEKA